MAEHLVVDESNANNGSLSPGLAFGAFGGEGIASKRTPGGNQFGLDFYTGGNARLKISDSGNVGIGIGASAPATALHLPAGGLQIGASATATDNFHLVSDTSGGRGLRIYNKNFGGGTHLLTVLPTGNVGIGTTAPDDKLDVEGNIRINDKDLMLRGGTDPNHGVGFYGATKLYAGTSLDGPSVYGWMGGALGTTSGGQRIALHWNADGNVSIGKANPQAKLEVAGDALLSGNYNITTRRGVLHMGTTDGSQAAADEVVGGIGFWGFGRQHGQLSFRAGRGFELVDRSTNGPSLSYGYNSQPYADLKLRGLTCAGGDIRWGNNSLLTRDQGGSIELGGDNSTAGTGVPYIDFHYGGIVQDFNARIINDGNGQLTVQTSLLRLVGNRIRAENGGRTLDMRADGAALDLESNGADLYINNNGRAVKVRNLDEISSRELKENIVELSTDEALEALEALNPVLFNWRDDAEKRMRVGFIAEDMPKIAGTPDGKAVVPTHILAILSKVVREQQRIITAMSRELRMEGGA